MNFKISIPLFLLSVGINLVPSYSLEGIAKGGRFAVLCPRNCNNPRSKEDCLSCLNDGYSDVVRHRGTWADLRPSEKLEQGAWMEWDDGRCWIHLKGIDSAWDCSEVGHGIFGYGRCSGFEGINFKSVTGRCWARFKKV